MEFDQILHMHWCWPDLCLNCYTWILHTRPPPPPPPITVGAGEGTVFRFSIHPLHFWFQSWGYLLSTAYRHFLFSSVIYPDDRRVLKEMLWAKKHHSLQQRHMSDLLCTAQKKVLNSTKKCWYFFLSFFLFLHVYHHLPLISALNEAWVYSCSYLTELAIFWLCNFSWVFCCNSPINRSSLCNWITWKAIKIPNTHR